MTSLKNPHTHFIQAGTGQPVILVHGYGGSNRQWQSLLPELAAAGYQAFAPDLLGHGQTAKSPHSAYHISAVLNHFTAWVRSLRLSMPPVLIGHSMGAYLSLSYALKADQPIRGLFFANPYFSHRQLTSSTRLSLRRPRVSKAVLQLAPEWLIRSAVRLSQKDNNRLPRQMQRVIAEDYKRLDPAAIHAPRTVGNLYPLLKTVKQPTMVVWGERDLTLSPELYPRLCEAMPHAWTRRLPGGHTPHLSHPAAFNTAVLDFLGSLHAPQSAPGDWEFCAPND